MCVCVCVCVCIYILQTQKENVITDNKHVCNVSQMCSYHYHICVCVFATLIEWHGLDTNLFDSF
jgi:hypothetical protein